MEEKAQERRTYSKEFKLEAVRMYNEQGMGKKTITKELGVKDPKTVREWIRKYEKFGESAFDPKTKVNNKHAHDAKRGRPKKDKESLEERVKRLEIENEILKKTTKYFNELDRKGSK